MAPPQAALEHYLAQQRLTLATLAAVRALWSRMGNDLDGSFTRVGPSLVEVVTRAQLAAAASSAPYLEAVLAEMGTPAPPGGEVVPAAFAGVASGGGDLPGLMEQAVVRTKTALLVPDRPSRFGVPRDAAGPTRLRLALAAGARLLSVIVQSEVADAERGATQAGMTVRPKVRGYTRMLNLPSCRRCVPLAGRTYAWNAGFQRHPGCDCRHVPFVDRATPTTDPRRAVESGQVTGLTLAERRAIADGADPNQVLNAKREGAISEDGLWTREGTTRRGYASRTIRAQDPGADETRSRERGRTQRRVMRPTVDQIYRYADSRADAIDLLRRSGYVI